MKTLIDLSLPEFAFVEGSWHEEGGDPLEQRTVITHTRSASVFEVALKGDVMLAHDTHHWEFGYTNMYGVKEHHVLMLHYSPLLDPDTDRGLLEERVVRPLIRWYCDYLTWEDSEG